MSISTIDELDIVEVMEPGVPNKERIAIQVKSDCDLSQFFIVVGVGNPDGSVVPIRDNMLWFGHGWVSSGDWIMVYTASGQTTITPYGDIPPGSVIQPRVISIHWGKDLTVFQNRAVTPMLMKVEAVGRLNIPAPAYQGTSSFSQGTLR